MIFGFFKKKLPPILRPEMLQPADAPITTAEAKRIFKEWMLRFDQLEKAELVEHVGYFADAMKEHEQMLKEDLAYTKEQHQEELDDLKNEIAEIKKELAGCTDPAEKEGLRQDLTDTKKALETASRGWLPEANALEAFRADKRAFLIDYINTEVHGPDWKSKAL